MTKKRSLIATCFLVSLSLHLFFLAFFARHPLVLQSRFAALFRKSAPPQETILANEDDLLHQEMLDEVFGEFVKPNHKEIPFDLRFHPGDFHKQPSEELVAQVPSLPEAALDTGEAVYMPAMVAPSLVDVLASCAEVEKLREQDESIFPQLALEKRGSIEPKTSLTASLALDTVDDLDDKGLNSMPLVAMVESNLPPASLIESFAKEPSLDVLPELRPSIDAPLISADRKEKAQPILTPQSPIITLGKDGALGTADGNMPLDLDDYQLPEIAKAAPLDEAFDVQVQLMPHPEGKGYVFSINLSPTDEIAMENMSQNYYFLIDRSSSIERHRFAAYKRGVIKALACLQAGDKFNIVLFDKKIRRMSDTPVLFSKAALQRAEEFLESQDHAGTFASTDPYAALNKILPSNLSENEAHTAILISDGGSTRSLARHQKYIAQWINRNEGKITVHAAAVGKDNNLIMLDLLSSLSGGQLLHSDTHAAFPRKLGKLLLDQRHPMIKELMITAVAKDSDAEVLFYPSSMQLPTLFAGRPYEIVGTVSSYSDFTVLIQGRSKDQLISISKEISLKKSTKAPRLLEKKWAKVNVRGEYESFLKEGKVASLLKAKELLKSSGSEPIR